MKETNNECFRLLCESSGRKYEKNKFDSISLNTIKNLIKYNNKNKQLKFLISSELCTKLLFIWQGILLSGSHLTIAENSILENIISSFAFKNYDYIITDFDINRKIENHTLLTDIELIEVSEKNADFNKIIESKITTFTSGTTSKPKKITRGYQYYKQASVDFVNHMLISEQKIKTIATFSGMYLGSIFNLFILPYSCNWDLVIPNKKGIMFWGNLNKYINNYNLNLIWTTPGILNTLIKINFKIDIKKSMDLIFLSGTDYLSYNTWKEFTNILKVPLLNTYGLSETLFISAQNKNEYKTYSTGSLLKDNKVHFKKVKNAEIKLKDKEYEQYELSELLVKTPYFCDELKKNSTKDYFFNTGDLVKEEKLSNKELNIIGRSKDIIIKGGINISPNYIESLLIQNKDINECCVYPIQDDIYGELIGCTIVPTNINFDKKKLLLSISSELPNNLIPDRISFIDKLPKTISGKVIKNQLIQNK